jgi:hypothetical protein
MSSNKITNNSVRQVYECEEKVDLDKLRVIIENLDDLNEKRLIGEFRTSNTMWKVATQEQVRTILTKFEARKMRTSTVKYKKTGSGVGRIYSVGESLQGMHRTVRHTVGKDIYTDIDVVNCHPVILAQLCEKWGYPCSHLKSYILNREKHFKDLLDLNDGMDRDTAKRAFLVLINEGLIKCKYPSKFILGFDAEASDIRNRFLETEEGQMYAGLKIDNMNAKGKRNRERKGENKTPYNIGGKVISMKMTAEEDKILNAMIDFCEEEKIRVGTLCYDGLMVYTDSLSGTNEEKGEMLGSMEIAIYDETGYDVTLKFKEMDEGIDLSGYKSYITTKNIPESVRYVKPFNFNESRSIAIKSSMGSGKTTTAINFIKNNVQVGERVLILSPRKTFATGICSEYNRGLEGSVNYVPFINYIDVEKKRENLGDIARLVVSMESLHYLKDSPIPDYIVVDECEANLNSHISKTNGKNLSCNVCIFNRYLTSPKCKILWADAFLSPKTTQFINDLQIDTIVYNYHSKMVKRTAFRLPPLDKETAQSIRKSRRSKEDQKFLRVRASSYYKLLCHKLELGEKVYFPCSSKCKVEEMNLLLLEDFPDKKMLFYTGATSKKNLTDINTIWGECDLVMTTTTITVGLNFDVKDHFDCIIIYMSSMARNLAVDLIQCHYRVRHLKSDNLYFFIHHVNTSLRSRDEIDKAGIVRELFHHKNYAGFSPTCEPSIRNLYINQVLEKERSEGLLREEFESFLIMCNYTIEDFIGIENDVAECIEDAVIPVPENEPTTMAEWINVYRQIPELGFTNAGELRAKRDNGCEPLSPNEVLQLKKHSLQVCFDYNYTGSYYTGVTEEMRVAEGMCWYLLCKEDPCLLRTLHR